MSIGIVILFVCLAVFVVIGILRKKRGNISQRNRMGSCQFSDPGYKPFVNILVSSINQMGGLGKQYELSYNQLKIILKQGNLQKITETLLYSWKKSVAEDQHIIAGVNGIDKILLVISCFPTGSMTEAKSKYLGIRYPYCVSNIMKQANHNILQKGFVHILFAQDRDLKQFNIDYLSLPAFNDLDKISYTPMLIMPRPDYFNENDYSNFNILLNNALTRDGLINGQIVDI
jgi:hypothetical protein